MKKSRGASLLDDPPEVAGQFRTPDPDLAQLVIAYAEARRAVTNTQTHERMVSAVATLLLVEQELEVAGWRLQKQAVAECAPPVVAP